MGNIIIKGIKEGMKEGIKESLGPVGSIYINKRVENLGQIAERKSEIKKGEDISQKLSGTYGKYTLNAKNCRSVTDKYIDKFKKK